MSSTVSAMEDGTLLLLMTMMMIKLEGWWTESSARSASEEYDVAVDRATKKDDPSHPGGLVAVLPFPY